MGKVLVPSSIGLAKHPQTLRAVQAQRSISDPEEIFDI
jgi:hypothetical protein